MRCVVIFSVLFITACGETGEYTPVKPIKGLEDCRFFREVDQGTTYKIVRCPNSTTTTSSSQLHAKPTAVTTED